MLRELHDKNIKTLNSKYFNLGNNEAKSNEVQFDMVELHRKYNNLSNVDRLHAVKTEVEDIKIVMRTNVNKMVDNIDQVEVLYFLF
jgi:hypothetical protein